MNKVLVKKKGLLSGELFEISSKVNLNRNARTSEINSLISGNPSKALGLLLELHSWLCTLNLSLKLYIFL